MNKTANSPPLWDRLVRRTGRSFDPSDLDIAMGRVLRVYEAVPAVCVQLFAAMLLSGIPGSIVYAPTGRREAP